LDSSHYVVLSCLLTVDELYLADLPFTSGLPLSQALNALEGLSYEGFVALTGNVARLTEAGGLACNGGRRGLWLVCAEEGLEPLGFIRLRLDGPSFTPFNRLLLDELGGVEAWAARSRRLREEWTWRVARFTPYRLIELGLERLRLAEEELKSRLAWAWSRVKAAAKLYSEALNLLRELGVEAPQRKLEGEGLELIRAVKEALEELKGFTVEASKAGFSNHPRLTGYR